MTVSDFGARLLAGALLLLGAVYGATWAFEHLAIGNALTIKDVFALLFIVFIIFLVVRGIHLVSRYW